MIIDSHFHLEPDLMSIEEMMSAMDSHGITKTALIAGMCHGLSEPGESMLRLMRMMLGNSWTRKLVCPLLTRFTLDGDIKLPKGLVAIESDPDNAKVFSVVDSYPEKFMAWVFVNPKGKKDPVAEFEKWMNHSGCIGVKVHPFWHQYRPIDLLPVAQKTAAMGKPMLMHTGFDEHGDVLALIRKVPNLKLILAHAGFPAYRDMWQQIKPYPTISVDLSATAYVDEKIIRQVVEFLGADRCIFGTDGPFGSSGKNGMFDYGVIKKRIILLFKDEAIQRKLFHENFQKMIDSECSDASLKH